MDIAQFEEALRTTAEVSPDRKGIGTLGEKSLHAVLKNYFEPHKENQEVRIGGFVADIVGENGIIEIQTKNFSRLNKKLERFLEFCNVTVVFPVEENRHILWVEPDSGENISRRLSPRHGTVYDVMPELYRIRSFLDNPRLRICVCMLDTEEIRLLDGIPSNRKKRSTRYDKIPVSLNKEIWFENPFDYVCLIPEILGESFTSAGFSAAAGISRSAAQVTLNLMNRLKIVERVDRKGNALIYSRSEFFQEMQFYL